MAKEAKKQDPQQQLEALFNKLVKQHSEFTQPLVELASLHHYLMPLVI
ncbi:hypothetical protein [Escherichia coli]|nr:hypothetical protein [Escherichia coli]GDG71391.1 hypothetical protein BvCmsKSNP018_00150 [Escherichia coli]GDL72856.1 hypothetical protein BvCmsKSNP073_02738 [Escherichia coli]GDM68436.1 hypothetical protein BvCmsNSNP024_01989 [Escherichia coli]HDX7463823.1 hypothetical protein [Escherichia coli]